MAGICIVGAACRLPGAPDEASFRDLLNRGGSAVGPLPADRWRPDLLYHPDPRTAGAAYTFSGGFLPAPYDFDLGVFGMSPREAVQVDPQQRLLAEVVWEALEDARIPPTSLAGQEVGVYVGVSALDHANLFGGDPGSIGSHFMTGNTLSIVANRISYLFDLKGPSFIVDTACSASLVAVDRAVADLRSGRIDTAIVGGVNMLLSPAAFVGFSRASMLSPTGACRPFSAQADGYVRSEGAAVFVLRRQDAAVPGSIRAMIAASAVNSDGRTSGIALPGLGGQRALLERAYGEAGIAPDDLAFVEAHGTGTAVGDPIEATALGQVLGRHRSRPLPIGSVKSNIGHLEPASGVAGMMKALIALEQRRLPATLHLGSLSPHISFAALNLQPAAESVALGDGPLHCGISSFGFGGTNAHVVLSAAPKVRRRPARRAEPPDVLVVSAHCRDALATLARSHARQLEAGIDPAGLAGAAIGGRALMRQRAVLPVGDAAAMATALRGFAAAGHHPAVTTGSSLAAAAKVCFVYNGNGAQWAGMGRVAQAANPTFAKAFAEADAAFRALGIDSLTGLLHADDLADRLGCAACAQPLIFAIQAGITAALAERGLRPAVVLGHSVGEIAAAHAAGVLDLDQAARILAARARSQEAVRGIGGMATLAAGEARIARLIAETGLPDLCVAADNGPGSVTISGSGASLAAFLERARRERIAARLLDVDYPYHSPLLDGIKGRFLEETGILAVRRPQLAMISTVTGEGVADRGVESSYWWQNIRRKVLFRQAIRTAAEQGANLFVEIGPRAILSSAIGGSVEEAGMTARVLPSLGETDAVDRDPAEAVMARAIANGFEPPWRSAHQATVDRAIGLPSYPWQRQTYRYVPSNSALDIHGIHARHPLIGARVAQGATEWRSVIDAQSVPYLADHVLGGEIVVPATALLEMALAVAREIWPATAICVEDLDIVQAMVLPAEGQREVSLRYAEASGGIEIHSRPRFGGDDWTLCARGRVAPVDSLPGAAPQVRGNLIEHRDAAAIYRRASDSGIEYGPAFRLFEGLRRDDDELIDISLAVPGSAVGEFGRPQVLHPATLDAAFHGLFDLLGADASAGKTWLPIRFERLTVWQDAARVTAATIVVDKSGDQRKTVTLWLRDANDAVVARLDRALLRAVRLSDKRPSERLFHLAFKPAGLAAGSHDLLAQVEAHFANAGIGEQDDGWLLLRAHMRASAYAALRGLAGRDGVLDVPGLLRRARRAPQAEAFVGALFGELAAAGLLKDHGGQVRLSRESGLPEAEVILATFAAEYPLAATDLALSAQAAATLSRTLADWNAPAPRVALAERNQGASLRALRACDALLGCVAALVRDVGDGQLHVLVADQYAGAIVGRLAEQAACGKLRLSLAVEDAVAAERLTRRLAAGAAIEIVDLSRPAMPCIDAALLVWPSGGCAPSSAVTAGMAASLRPGGVLLAAQLADDPVAAFHHGPHDETAASDRSLPLGERLRADPALGDHIRFGEEQAGLVIYAAGRHATRGEGEQRPSALCIVHSSSRAVASFSELTAALEKEGIDCLTLSGQVGSRSAPVSRNLVYLIDDIDDDAGLVEVLAALRGLLIGTRADHDRPRLWIAAVAGGAHGAAHVAAIRAFVRVAMNERADRDIRFVEIGADAAPGDIAGGIAGLIAAGGGERELRIGRTGRQVSRVAAGLPLARSPADAAGAAALHFPRPGMLDNFQWREAERGPPGPLEIEVEVAATGLNFRDVMLAMGLLNDDVLDEGLAGPVLGLECAGRVAAVGDAVTGHRVGDAVTGFGIDGFATHVRAAQDSFVPIPAGLSLEAAAGIPVAFTTAWYALVELARLRPGERVLIHGGAGSVGLAAIQIARHAGAEVIATVSAADKEAVARLYGAAHVYDSRSLGFVDAVRDGHGGVDVVLNSLAGDAMRGSIKCLRPRGRFVELGKRDYVENSLIGLRPFRRNLSYFGVDVDQLMLLDPAVVAAGLQAVCKGFADGIYMPLPTATYRAAEIGEAFRLMQGAGHVGKIVVTPPPLASVAATATASFAPGELVQLVVGGTRGFGLATALWLAERGARRIVVASRSGRLDPAWQAAVDALRQGGVRFEIERVDVADLAEVRALVARVTAAHGPIGGVYHTAVALRDGLIENLSDEALGEVLSPKAKGARNLDTATRGQPIEQFVLYSSAAAFVGNPGQAAYAAANGYLEGLARRRRGEGLPALAVAWGPIVDVGLLADRPETIASLNRVAGVAGMTAREALDELGRMLPLADRLADPVLTCAEFAGGGALEALPVSTSPAFAALFAGRNTASVEGAASLSELVAGKPEGEANRIIAALLAEEVAQILRLATPDVDLDASIDGLGMDSLMALELRMSIETRYRVELPVMAISAAGTLRELAHRILLTLRRDDAADQASPVSDTESALLAIHDGGGMSAEDANSTSRSGL